MGRDEAQGQSLDGPLPPWEAVADAEEWRVLLLGNGMSINVWNGFAYGSLYAEAQRRGALSAEDDALFASLRTVNFEVVLATLSVTDRAHTALGRSDPAVRRSYRAIRAALAAVLRGVHIPRSELPAESLQAMTDAILTHQTVFTTNYDLLCPWAMESVSRGSTPVHYLHGGLHLLVHRDGTVQKQPTTGVATITDRLESDGDDWVRPLLVTEGTAREKRLAIKANRYLESAFAELVECGLPLVVFGSELSPCNQHLLDAINAHPRRPVAVSVCSSGRQSDCVSRQAAIRSCLRTRSLYFFDAASHPLGRGPGCRFAAQESLGAAGGETRVLTRGRPA